MHGTSMSALIWPWRDLPESHEEPPRKLLGGLADFAGVRVSVSRMLPYESTGIGKF